MLFFKAWCITFATAGIWSVTLVDARDVQSKWRLWLCQKAWFPSEGGFWSSCHTASEENLKSKRTMRETAVQFFFYYYFFHNQLHSYFTLKVKVYMGDGWHLDFKQTHFDLYSPPDFYTRVRWLFNFWPITLLWHCLK